MCGHGMVSMSLAKKMIDWVKEGRRTPEQASVVLTRFCSCGVFNPSRATTAAGRGAGADEVRRRALTLVVALAICAAACGGATPAPAEAPATPAPAAADVLVLNNFTLIDGRGGPAVADSALIATDGRITWIGPKSELKAPAGAPVQDLTGKFVMPGLIDLHTHVSNSDVVKCRIRSSSSRAKG